MRQILVDHARARSAQKRGGAQAPITLVDAPLDAPVSVVDMLALDEARAKLADHDPRMAELVELRFFGGLTIEEAAETMGISLATAKRWWKFSKAWLHRELQPWVLLSSTACKSCSARHLNFPPAASAASP
jgi:RNA polymerase sigma-70 factor (ECF subfamily)